MDQCINIVNYVTVKNKIFDFGAPSSFFLFLFLFLFFVFSFFPFLEQKRETNDKKKETKKEEKKKRRKSEIFIVRGKATLTNL
jgi:hypothetical protein